METAMQPLILRPNSIPFNFVDKWNDPIWKCQGVYIWSIAHNNAFLASYAGQSIKGKSNFDKRIWQEYKWWQAGKDWPVDIEQYKQGIRVELEKPQLPEHTASEIAELSPIIRVWLMPLANQSECDQAERWLVAELCKHPKTRQFLANRNVGRYRPDPTWPVRIEVTPFFRIVGLTVPVPTDPAYTS